MNKNVKTLTLIVGTLLGAFLGYRAAQNFIETSHEQAARFPISATQGLQVGLAAVTALKQIGKISREIG